MRDLRRSIASLTASTLASTFTARNQAAKGMGGRTTIPDEEILRIRAEKKYLKRSCKDIAKKHNRSVRSVDQICDYVTRQFLEPLPQHLDSDDYNTYMNRVQKQPMFA